MRKKLIFLLVAIMAATGLTFLFLPELRCRLFLELQTGEEIPVTWSSGNFKTTFTAPTQQSEYMLSFLLRDCGSDAILTFPENTELKLWKAKLKVSDVRVGYFSFYRTPTKVKVSAGKIEIENFMNRLPWLKIAVYSLVVFGVFLVWCLQFIPLKFERFKQYFKEEYIFSFLFFFLLCLPLLISYGNGFSPTVLSQENRALTKFPEIHSFWDLLKNSQTIEAFLQDYIPYRGSIIELNNKLNATIGAEPPQKFLVYGSDKRWLFFDSKKADNTGDTFGDYYGTTCFNQEQLYTIDLALSKMKEELDRRNIKLIFLIGPNKQTVYEQYLPARIRMRKGNNSPAKQLQQWGASHNIPVIFPYEELRNFPYYTYYPDATHWNWLGGYIASQKLFTELGHENILPDLTRETMTKIDLTMDAGWLTTRDPSIIDLIPTRYLEKDFFPLYEKDVHLMIRTYPQKPEAPIQTKILFMHDSFLESMIPFVYSECGQIYSIWDSWNGVSPEILDTLKPQVVVYVLVERNLFGLASSPPEKPSARRYTDFTPTPLTKHPLLWNKEEGK